MSERRPRALLLTPAPPCDAGNGLAMRAGLLLSGLARRFRVGVVTPPPGPSGRSAAFIAQHADGHRVLAAQPAAPAVDAAALLATAAARERAGLVRPLPALCRGGPAAWAAEIADRAAGADLIVVFRSYLAPWLDVVLENTQRPAIWIDVDEIDSDVQRSLGHGEEAARFERLERYYLPRADHVTVASAPDAERLAQRHGLAAVSVIPNAVPAPGASPDAPPGTPDAPPVTPDAPPVTPDAPPVAPGVAPAAPDAPPAGDLLFVGNLSYAPNVEGARWLCEAVLPLLDGVTVTIAGSQPAAEVLALARDPRVRLLADPDEIASCYARCRVAVVPLQRGGGSRLKLIEALAHGRPVVSTAAGAHGHSEPGDSGLPGVVLADRAPAFADACRRLLADPVEAEELGRRGRVFVATRATFDVVAPRVARLGAEALRRRRPETAAPLLTAALIMRDEETVLGECLRSLQGLADEVVIVDTGSGDRSVAIAEQHGARVLHRPWDGDFAAPRNLGLEHTRGEWVLYIDADERLAPLERAELQRALGGSAAAALRVLLAPRPHATPYFEYRLWRNDPRIRFAGAIHEQVVDAIHAAAREDARAVDDWPGLRLDHVGYEGDQSRKHRRNLPLLQAQLSRDPSNIYNWRHLARVLDGLGRVQEAADARERAVRLALAEPVPSVDGGLAWAERLAAEHERGTDVGPLLALGRERWPQHWLIRWIEGVVALEAGQLDAAAEAFRALLAADTAALPASGIAYDERMFGEWAHASLALTHLRAGRNAEAAAAYAAAERCAPDNPEYRVKRALAVARSGAASAR